MPISRDARLQQLGAVFALRALIMHARVQADMPGAGDVMDALRDADEATLALAKKVGREIE